MRARRASFLSRFGLLSINMGPGAVQAQPSAGSQSSGMRRPPWLDLWVWVVFGALWSLGAQAQQACFVAQVSELGFNDFGQWPTFEAAALDNFNKYSACWTDGKGGCQSLSLGACAPGGIPSRNNLQASCQLLGNGSPLVTFLVAAGQIPCANWVKVPQPQVCAKACVGDPINPGPGNVYKQEEDDVRVSGASPI